MGSDDGPYRRNLTLAVDEPGDALLLLGGPSRRREHVRPHPEVRRGGGDEASRRWWEPTSCFGPAVAFDPKAHVPSLLGDQVGAAFYGDTWRFDPTTETCETIEKLAASAPRRAHSAVLAKGGNPIVLSPHRRSWRSRLPNAVATGHSRTWYGLRPACPLARRDST